MQSAYPETVGYPPGSGFVDIRLGCLVYLDQSHEDASEGIDMMCIMIDRFAKVDDAYLLGLQERCWRQCSYSAVSIPHPPSK